MVLTFADYLLHWWNCCYLLMVPTSFQYLVDVDDDGVAVVAVAADAVVAAVTCSVSVK
jgi:hypothetical protein